MRMLLAMDLRDPCGDFLVWMNSVLGARYEMSSSQRIEVLHLQSGDRRQIRFLNAEKFVVLND